MTKKKKTTTTTTTTTTQSVLQQLAAILKTNVTASTLSLVGIGSLCAKIRQTIDEGFLDEDLSDAFSKQIRLEDVNTVIQSCISTLSSSSSSSLGLEDVMEIAFTFYSIAETSAMFVDDYMEKRHAVEIVETTQKFWRSLDTVKMKALLSSGRKIVSRALRSSLGFILIVISEDKNNFRDRWKGWPSGTFFANLLCHHHHQQQQP